MKPVATLSLPELKVDRPFGSVVDGTYRLASPFDSTRFKVIYASDGTVIFDTLVGANTGLVEEGFHFDVEGFLVDDLIQNINIILLSYDDTLVFEEIKSLEVFKDIKTSVVDYENDFEQNTLDFCAQRFLCRKPGSQSKHWIE